MAGNQTAVLDVLVNLSLQKVKEQAKQIGKTIEQGVQANKTNNIPAPNFKVNPELENLSQKNIPRLLNEFHKLNNLGLETTSTMNKLNFVMKKLNPSLKGNQINSQLKEMIRNTKQFDFGFLSLLFAGQMLQRTFGGFVKSIAQGFNDLTKHQTSFGKVTNKLSANFSFLKFAIGNALNNPIILAAMNLFANALENLGNFFAKHPNFAASIIGVGTAIAGIGAGAILVSAGKQIGLMTDELFKFGKSVNSLDIKKLGGLYKTLGKLSKVGIVLTLGKMTFDGLNNLNGVDLKLFDVISTALTVGGILSLARKNSKVGGAVKGKILPLAISAGIVINLLKPVIGKLTNINTQDFLNNILTLGFLARFTPTTIGKIIVITLFLELKWKIFSKSWEFLTGLVGKASDKVNTITSGIKSNGGIWNSLFPPSQQTYIENGTLKIKGIDDKLKNVSHTSIILKKDIKDLVKHNTKNFNSMDTDFGKNVSNMKGNITDLKKELKNLTSQPYNINITKTITTVNRSSGSFTTHR